MSSDGVLVTPVELNRNLLNSFFKFKPQSKLELFITKKKNLEKKIFTLAEVRVHTPLLMTIKQYCFVLGSNILERYH